MKKMLYHVTNQLKAEIEKVADRPFYEMKFTGNDHFEEYLQRGVSDMEDYVRFIEEVLLSGHMNVRSEPFGCAAFTAKNLHGDSIFARNMDCECAIPMLVRLNEPDKYKSMSFVNMSMLDWEDTTFDSLEEDARYTLAGPYSPEDGINEDGLAIAILTDSSGCYSKDKMKRTLFDMTIPRLILDKARTVEEGIELFNEYNLFYDVAPLHFMIADQSGKSAVIEYVDGKMVVTKASGYQVVTNFRLYNNPEHSGFGKDRYDNIVNALEACHGNISENDALELLKANVIKGDEQWSAVYNLTKKVVKITFSGDYQQVYTCQL